MPGFQKIIAVVLAVAVFGIMVSGCNRKDNINNSNVSISSDGEFVPTKDLDLRIWEIIGTDYVKPQSPDVDIPGDWLKSKTKVSVQSVFGNDGGGWDVKLGRLVAADNLPHILHCNGYQGPAHYAKMDQIGMLWELTPELLQQYAPNVWNRVPKEMWERMKVNGKITGIPLALPVNSTTQPLMSEEQINFVKDYIDYTYDDLSYDNSKTLWIRDDVVKKLYPNAMSYDEICALLEEKNAPIGEEILDIPINSTEDYVKMLYNIKELNLKEGDKTVYAFGYPGGDNWVALSIFGSDLMGYKSHFYTGSWNSVTQSMRLPLVEPIVKEAARLQNQFIRDKVTEPESLINNLTTFKQKVLNGQYAIAYLPATGMQPAEINKMLKEQGKQYQYRPLVTQVPAVAGYESFKEPDLWQHSLALLKTLNEEELKQVLNWLNVQFSDEWEEVINWGPKEANLYTETEDGKRKYIDERFNKYSFESDSTALDAKDSMGICGFGGWSVSPTPVSRWTPSIMQGFIKMTPTHYKAFKSVSSSQHVKNVKTFPPCQGWSPEYAQIPEVIKFWEVREQWEQPFKFALTSDTEEIFNKKWDDAVANLNSLVDINAMCEKMTEIARVEAEKLK